MTWTYNVANLTNATSAAQKDQVRFLVGDTKSDDQQLQDEEVYFTIAMFPNPFRAAAACCWNLSTYFARRADSAQGPLHTAYSQQSRNYAAAAARWTNQANLFTSAAGYCGGISIADKANAEQDPDRVPPNFNIGMTDNANYPLAPAGNESPDNVDASQLP